MQLQLFAFLPFLGVSKSFPLFQRSLKFSQDPESWEEWADDQQELDEILYGYGFSYSHRRTLSLLFCYPNVGFAEDAPFFLKLRDMFGKDKVQLYKDGVGLSGLVCVCVFDEGMFQLPH